MSRIHRLRRQELLQAMSAVGAFGMAGCASQNNASEAPSTMPLGVASGDVTSTGAVLWTRYLGERALEAVVWEGGPGEAAEVHASSTTPADGGFVHLEVDGLRPGGRYTYAFFERVDGERGARSPLGSFRTAPAFDALAPVSFGATSCTRYGHPMGPLRQAAQRTDLDLFLFLGDNVYADAERTLPGYRRMYERTLAQREYRELRAAHSLLATWDDHEVANDWAGETVDPQRRAAATQVFFEHQPLRRQRSEPGRLWRSARWGRTAEFFVLDSRGERRPSTRLRSDAEYLSRTQMDWLKAGLAQTPAAFKVILNSVPVSQFQAAPFQVFAPDRWEGYPAARREILRFIEEQSIPGVLWLSGDFHLASMGRVSLDGPGSRAVEVLVGPGANAPNPSPSYPSPPQFDWASGVNNYAAFRLEPEGRRVRVTFHGPDDEVLTERTYAL